MSLEELQEHSPVGPSSGERWLHCPGSVPATKDLPDTSSDFAAEGTFAHYISELCRKEDKEPRDFLGVVSDDGKFEVNTEMVDALNDFIAYAEQFEGDTFVEVRVHYDDYVTDGFGTGDHLAIDDFAKTALVMDLKYGKGIQVNAKGNIQLKLYALGTYQDYSALYDIDKFILAISQPRLNHRDQWEISTEKLLKWAEEVVRPAGVRVEEAQEIFDNTGEIPDEYFRAGAWCQWCKIRGTCATRAALVRESVMADVDDLDAKPVNQLSDDQLGESFGMLAMVRKWCNDIEEAVATAVSRGGKIKSGEDEDGNDEFFKMVEGRSDRKWRDPAKAEKRLRAARLRIDDIFTKKLIGPAPAEKLLGKTHKILKEEVVKPQGKPVLVPGSDPRDVYKVVAIDEMDDLDKDDDNENNADDFSWLNG